jgi:hypothetical protein
VPAGSSFLGPLPDSTYLHVDVVLSPHDPAALAAAVAAVSTPGSPAYRHYLARGRFAARWGPTVVAVAAVERWLRAAHLSVGRMSADHLTIAVAGDAAALGAALQTRWDRFRTASGVDGIAPASAPVIPAPVAPDVAGIVGLDTLVPPAPLGLPPSRRPVPPSLPGAAGEVPASVVTGGPQPCAAAAAAAGAGGALTADRLASTYGFSGLYGRGDEGAGVTVGIFELEGGDGGVFDFNQPYHGSVGFPSPPGLGLHIYNFVAMATSPDGYWLAQRNGGVFSFNAPFEGSLPNSGINVDDIVGIASTPDGGGYWLASSDGTVYNFGDARDFGSLSAGVSNDIVAIASPDAGGYWLVGGNGAIYSFGNAHFHGSCPTAGSGCTSLASPIVGMAAPDAGGYWLVAADGGVFTFGDARYFGSCPQAGSPCGSLTSPVIGLAAPDGGGYWLATAVGGVYTFGDAHFYGSCPQAGSACTDLVRPIVAVTS